MSDLVTEFLRFLEVSKVVSKHTLKAYALDLKIFGAFLESQGLGFKEVNHLHIRAYLGFFIKAFVLLLIL